MLCCVILCDLCVTGEAPQLWEVSCLHLSAVSAPSPPGLPARLSVGSCGLLSPSAEAPNTRSV